MRRDLHRSAPRYYQGRTDYRMNSGFVEDRLAARYRAGEVHPAARGMARTPGSTAAIGIMTGNHFDPVQLGALDAYEAYVSDAERLRGRHARNPSLMQRDLAAHLRATAEASRDLDRFYHRIVKVRAGEPIRQA
jgi:hypothetical protein